MLQRQYIHVSYMNRSGACWGLSYLPSAEKNSGSLTGKFLSCTLVGMVEGLRVDSLVVGNMRISQLVAGICVVVSVILLLVIGGRVRRMGSDYQLYCNTEACKQMMAELDAKREASGKKAAASVALDSAKEPEDETSEPEETSEAKTDAPEENDK